MKNYVITSILFLIGLTLHAQEKRIIKIKETAPNGKEIQHKDNFHVIDPNSILTIELEKKELYARIADTSGNKEITAKLNKLREMVENEVKAMSILAGAMEQFKKGDKSNMSWQQALRKLAPYTNLIARDPEGQKAYALVRGNGASNLNEQYSILFKAAAFMVQNIEDQIKTEAKAKGSYIQFGAWIDTKKGQTALHIPGFDDIAPQKPYQVSQFVYILPEDQKREIEAISKIANVANNDGLGAALNARNAIRQIFVSALETETGKNLQKLEDRVRSLLDKSTNDLGIARSALQDSHHELLLYNAFVNGAIDKYKKPFAGSSDAHLLGFNSDVEELTLKTDSLHALLAKNSTLIHQQIASVHDGLKNEVIHLSDSLEKVSKDFYNDIAIVKGRVRDAVQILIYGEKFRSEAYEFSREIKKMTLDQLPESAVLNLETSGERDLGDALVLKLAIGKKNSLAVTDLETIRYRLFFCSPFVRTAVSFLFLDPVPLTKRTEGKALFQYAPSYSILLKGIWKNKESSRRSLTYHTFFSPGIGLNIASLDFNSDGAMEIGMGGTFVIFQDFLQLGYGANLFSGRGYSFFGLRIPVGAFTIR